MGLFSKKKKEVTEVTEQITRVKPEPIVIPLSTLRANSRLSISSLVRNENNKREEENRLKGMALVRCIQHHYRLANPHREARKEFPKKGKNTAKRSRKGCVHYVNPPGSKLGVSLV